MQRHTQNNQYSGNRENMIVEKIINNIRNYFLKPGSMNTGLVHRIETDIDNIDPLVWLLNRKEHKKSFWSDREGRFRMAGIGEADVIEANGEANIESLIDRINTITSIVPESLKYFGGISFSENNTISEEWSGFGGFRFHLPEFELVKRNGNTIFAINIVQKTVQQPEKIIQKLIKKVNPSLFSEDKDISILPSIDSHENLVTKKEWMKRVNKAKDAIVNNEFQKIVLAKKTQFKLSGNLEPASILHKLNNNKMNSYTFYFQPEKNSSFIGNTPELLYRRTGVEIISEAIAGTRRRGGTEKEDRRIAKDLMNDKKDRFEHAFVQEFIEKALRKLSKSKLNESEVSVLKLPKVQHLYCKISSKLKSGINDYEIINALHPTPAVGGFEKEDSVPRIHDIEQFDRGWYAGPVGWISNKGAEFAVGIRSGLIQGDSMILYSGAGIVKGSDPEMEWIETENKMLNILRFFDRND